MYMYQNMTKSLFMSRSPTAPRTIKGGPEVVEFDPSLAPPPPKQRKKKAPRVPEPQNPKKKHNREPKEEILTEAEFVKKYRKDAIKASWDPKVLRKCGKGAKEIFETMGCKFKHENTPMKEMQRQRQQKIDKGLIPDRRF